MHRHSAGDTPPEKRSGAEASASFVARVPRSAQGAGSSASQRARSRPRPASDGEIDVSLPPPALRRRQASPEYRVPMAPTRLDEAAGLTVADVMHAKFSALPA